MTIPDPAYKIHDIVWIMFPYVVDAKDKRFVIDIYEIHQCIIEEMRYEVASERWMYDLNDMVQCCYTYTRPEQDILAGQSLRMIREGADRGSQITQHPCGQRLRP